MYQYQLPKCGHPKHWKRDRLKAVRDYWFDLHLEGESIALRRKQLTWAGACNYGCTWYSLESEAYPNQDLVLWLIDGRVPRSELGCPPSEAIWNRWERSPFVEDGIPSRQVVLLKNGLIEELS